MSRDASAERNCSLDDEMTTRSTIKTTTFLDTCPLDADHKALEEHLGTNPVQQSDLDRCLLRGLQIVQRKEQELSHVAQALTILLKSGAKWNSDVLLDKLKTPYHIICESPGDHYELFDLMIKSSQQAIIDTQDSSKLTAVVYAVRHANINCLKCLIATGADLDKGDDGHGHSVPQAPPQQWFPINEAIQVLGHGYQHTSANVHADIFDLLLDSKVEVNKPSVEKNILPIATAVNLENVYCVKKLIMNGARLKTDDRDVWVWVASMGNVELLKCMFNHGIHKDITTRNNVNILHYVVETWKVEAVRCLLDLGVAIPTDTFADDVHETQCEHCEEDMLRINDKRWAEPMRRDPCVRAIFRNKLEMVKLFEEYGSQSSKSLNALRFAIKNHNVEVVSYLLNEHTYPLNMEYINVYSHDYEQRCTLLSDAYLSVYENVQITKLLLDHGADPAKAVCSASSASALMAAICRRSVKLEVIAQFIRSGVDVNFKSFYFRYEDMLPFEASVLCHHYDVAEMLLISGCSSGVFCLDNDHVLKEFLIPEVKEQIKKWKLQENNVTPLKHRCRSVVLNQLSPRADLKIQKLPLPGSLIKFLYIHELDDIIDKDKAELDD